MKVLDVGCGDYPRGHVNVDPFIEVSIHRGSLKHPINTKGIVFVKASGEHLPFRSNVFDLVFSHAVMEHVNNPILFLKECYRVSKSVVKIIVPHRLARAGMRFHQGKGHINFFNVQYFKKLLRGYAYTVECSFESKPHKILPIFIMPYLITVTIYTEDEK